MPPHEYACQWDEDIPHSKRPVQEQPRKPTRSRRKSWQWTQEDLTADLEPFPRPATPPGSPEPVRREFPPQVEALYRRLFLAVDAKKYGHLTPREVRSAVDRARSAAGRLQITDAQFQQLYDEMDSNHDGIVTPEEFLAYAHARIGDKSSSLF